MQTVIRKWGNSAGAIIPAMALSQAGIAMGDTLELEIRDGEICLKPSAPKFTLDQLLEASPEGSFAMDQEDVEWLQDSPVGKELD